VSQICYYVNSKKWKKLEKRPKIRKTQTIKSKFLVEKSNKSVIKLLLGLAFSVSICYNGREIWNKWKGARSHK